MKILIFGAGRSAWYAIDYLFTNAAKHSWSLTVVDADEKAIAHCRQDFPGLNVIMLDVHDEEQRKQQVQTHDIIISLLPARFHILVAQDCLIFGKHLITPSYISEEIKALDAEAKEKGLIFLNEIGLDPGIDHMSAMHLLDRLKNTGAEIISFCSYTGGLVAKESDNNPWHYKISWNPYNVVRAGQDGGICLENGHFKFYPYNAIFDHSEPIHSFNGKLSGYVNRNSLPYIERYGLHGLKTFIRGTLRDSRFLIPWQFVVNIGLTNDKIIIPNDGTMTWSDFYKMFPQKPHEDLEENFAWMMHGIHAPDELPEMLEYLNWSSPEKIPLKDFTPAEALQHIIEQKWKMQPEDKDRVVMLHEVEFKASLESLGQLFSKEVIDALEPEQNQLLRVESTLDINGESASRTAMAKTVGLPLALAAEMIANNSIKTRGVLLPTLPEIYEPMLQKLAAHDIVFNEMLSFTL